MILLVDFRQENNTPTSHSKRWKSPAVKALRPVRGAYDISLTSHCPLTQAALTAFVSCLTNATL